MDSVEEPISQFESIPLENVQFDVPNINNEMLDANNTEDYSAREAEINRLRNETSDSTENNHQADLLQDQLDSDKAQQRETIRYRLTIEKLEEDALRLIQTRYEQMYPTSSQDERTKRSKNAVEKLRYFLPDKPDTGASINSNEYRTTVASLFDNAYSKEGNTNALENKEDKLNNPENDGTYKIDSIDGISSELKNWLNNERYVFKKHSSGADQICVKKTDGSVKTLTYVPSKIKAMWPIVINGEIQGFVTLDGDGDMASRFADEAMSFMELQTNNSIEDGKTGQPKKLNMNTLKEEGSKKLVDMEIVENVATKTQNNVDATVREKGDNRPSSQPVKPETVPDEEDPEAHFLQITNQKNAEVESQEIKESLELLLPKVNKNTLNIQNKKIKKLTIKSRERIETDDEIKAMQIILKSLIDTKFSDNEIKKIKSVEINTDGNILINNKEITHIEDPSKNSDKPDASDTNTSFDSNETEDPNVFKLKEKSLLTQMGNGKSFAFGGNIPWGKDIVLEREGNNKNRIYKFNTFSCEWKKPNNEPIKGFKRNGNNIADTNKPDYNNLWTPQENVHEKVKFEFNEQSIDVSPVLNSYLICLGNNNIEKITLTEEGMIQELSLKKGSKLSTSPQRKAFSAILKSDKKNLYISQFFRGLEYANIIRGKRGELIPNNIIIDASFFPSDYNLMQKGEHEWRYFAIRFSDGSLNQVLFKAENGKKKFFTKDNNKEVCITGFNKNGFIFADEEGANNTPNTTITRNDPNTIQRDRDTLEPTADLVDDDGYESEEIKLTKNAVASKDGKTPLIDLTEGRVALDALLEQTNIEIKAPFYDVITCIEIMDSADLKICINGKPKDYNGNYSDLPNEVKSIDFTYEKTSGNVLQFTAKKEGGIFKYQIEGETHLLY